MWKLYAQFIPSSRQGGLWMQTHGAKRAYCERVCLSTLHSIRNPVQSAQVHVAKRPVPYISCLKVRNGMYDNSRTVSLLMGKTENIRMFRSGLLKGRTTARPAISRDYTSFFVQLKFLHDVPARCDVRRKKMQIIHRAWQYFIAQLERPYHWPASSVFCFVFKGYVIKVFFSDYSMLYRIFAIVLILLNTACRIPSREPRLGWRATQLCKSFISCAHRFAYQSKTIVSYTRRHSMIGTILDPKLQP